LTISEEEAGDATGNVLTVNTVAGAPNAGIKGDVNLDGRIVVFPTQPGAGLMVGTEQALLITVTRIGRVETAVLSLTDIIVVGSQAQLISAITVHAEATITRSTGAAVSFSLHNAVPNPFNPSATVAYALPERTHVTLTVYNLLGQEVVRLEDQVQAAGQYSVTWHARNTQGISV
jgi:hypothetical protein